MVLKTKIDIGKLIDKIYLKETYGKDASKELKLLNSSIKKAKSKQYGKQRRNKHRRLEHRQQEHRPQQDMTEIESERESIKKRLKKAKPKDETSVHMDFDAIRKIVYKENQKGKRKFITRWHTGRYPMNNCLYIIAV